MLNVFFEKFSSISSLFTISFRNEIYKVFSEKLMFLICNLSDDEMDLIKTQEVMNCINKINSYSSIDIDNIYLSYFCVCLKSSSLNRRLFAINNLSKSIQFQSPYYNNQEMQHNISKEKMLAFIQEKNIIPLILSDKHISVIENSVNLLEHCASKNMITKQYFQLLWNLITNTIDSVKNEKLISNLFDIIKRVDNTTIQLFIKTLSKDKITPYHIELISLDKSKMIDDLYPMLFDSMVSDEIKMYIIRKIVDSYNPDIFKNIKFTLLKKELNKYSIKLLSDLLSRFPEPFYKNFLEENQDLLYMQIMSSFNSNDCTYNINIIK